MSTLLQRVDEPGDAELISAVRGGDVSAYGELFARHVEAARRLARQLVSAGDVDDLVSEAFAKVLVVLQRGGGPDVAFRAYLLTALRRLHVDRIRATARLHTTDDLTPFDPGVPFRDTAVEGFESAAAAKAFASLPERWQLVLWHTEVEGQKPADVAPLLGMSANSVSALAYRAREGLRQAFLSMHVQEVEDDTCAWTHSNLGAYVRGGASRRDAAKVEEHLDRCRACTAIYLELTEVNGNLSAILAPALLGGAAAAYLGTGGAVAGQGVLLLLLDRAKDFVLAHAPATAAAGVAATAVVGGALYAGLGGDRGAEPTASPPSAGPTGGAGDRSSAAPGTGDRRTDQRGDTPGDAGRDPGTQPGVVLPDEVLDGITAPPTPAVPSPGTPSAPPTPGQPDPPDQPDATPDPTTPPGADVHVSGSASAQGGGTYTVVIAVSGTGHDGATLTVTGDGIGALVTSDARCDLLGVGTGTCSVPAGSTAYEFTAVAPAGATLVFTVEGDETDPDPSDNRTVVDLGA